MTCSARDALYVYHRPKSGGPRNEAMTTLSILEVQLLSIERHFCALAHNADVGV